MGGSISPMPIMVTHMPIMASTAVAQTTQDNSSPVLMAEKNARLRPIPRSYFMGSIFHMPIHGPTRSAITAGASRTLPVSTLLTKPSPAHRREKPERSAKPTPTIMLFPLGGHMATPSYTPLTLGSA